MKLRRMLTAGTLTGLLVLGVGGRLVMRVIAHMEGRTPVLTRGTITVIFAGTLAGFLATGIYLVLQRFIKRPRVLTLVFIAIGEIIVLGAVHQLLAAPRLLFMALGLIFLGLVDLMGRR
jgi:hypothetical protein